MAGRLFAATFREAQGEVPPLGVIGPEAVREAFEGDLRQLQELLTGAVRKALELAGDDDWWPYVHALFEDFIVVEHKDGRLMRYPYQVDGTKVTLGTPIEVRKTFVPVSEGVAMTEAAAALALLEATDKAAGKWRIRVIRAGLSGNGNYYPDAVLLEAVPLFEGCRVFVKSDEEHLAGRGKDVRNLIGRLSEVAFVEGSAPDSGEIQATLQLIEPDGVVSTKLREAHARGMAELFGFSIDARAQAARVVRAGRTVREARKFIKVNSVDLIVEPGAGGGVIDLIEAQQETIMDREELIALLEAKGLLKGKDPDSLSDDDLKTMLREAVASTGAGAADDPDVPTPVREAVRMVEARARMRERIGRSQLPQAAKDRLVSRFEQAESFTEAEVDQAIKDEAEYLAQFAPSGRVTGMGDFPRIQFGETRAEKVRAMLEAFFDPDHKDHRHAQSFKECYVQITGDTRVTGMLQHCDQALLRESLDSQSFDAVLGDSITRRMVADYNSPTSYDAWRPLVNVVPVNDFRTQERTRFGGYGDIPKVAESGAYLPLASPDDEKATYAVEKRGGTEDVTIEMIKNDDVGAIRRIPTRLSGAAKRTLGKFVFDFFRTNPVIYDGLTLYHADHGNLGSAALDKATLAAGRLAMLKQTEAGSADPLGIGPRFITVPPDLEETAVDLFRRNTEQDKTFIQSLTLTVIPVWYWTDANDWHLHADPNDIPSIEIGFLDGQEEPELFVQDSPTSGSMFSHDKLTYKLRHIYGATVLDYRGQYGAKVA